MDERVFAFQKGKPIPAWDLAHRLPIAGKVSTIVRDGAATYRINSTFMDVSDQPNLDRQWIGFGVAGTILILCLSIFCITIFNIPPASLEAPLMVRFVTSIFFLFSFIVALYYGIKFGRDEFFALRTRPVRFNRKQRMIYAVRSRRFFAKAGKGDVIHEAPWSDSSIFCIHTNNKGIDKPYHIRHYTVDEAGNVLYAFAIGREWQGDDGLADLLAQWNYWCEYMNGGPEAIPEPMLYLPENETMYESFLYCMYQFGSIDMLAIKILLLPPALFMTFFRVLALSTCRAPKWSEAVLALSGIRSDDPYAQPKGSTPVGWGPTAVAIGNNEYPANPHRELAGVLTPVPFQP